MSYNSFALCYDRLTDNVNYAGYARRVHILLKAFCPQALSIAEIACGTASLGLELESLGYDVAGVDLSEEMLFEAQRKIIAKGSGIILQKQDMRELLLAKKYDAAVCSLDALNHLPRFEDVKMAFLAVRRNLRRGGLFIFDMNTPFKHREILVDNTFVYEKSGIYAVWQNVYRERDCSVGITLDLFFEGKDGYTRHRESFCEVAYPKRQVCQALKSCGFEVLGCYDELKEAPPTSRTERILYCCRRI